MSSSISLMFVRVKNVGLRRYVYLVEGVREEERRWIANKEYRNRPRRLPVNSYGFGSGCFRRFVILFLRFGRVGPLTALFTVVPGHWASSAAILFRVLRRLPCPSALSFELSA